MFNVDDNFLASVGYDVSALTSEQKAQYVTEITTELKARLADRLVSEIDEEQAADFATLQGNDERVQAWLQEFHPNYASDTNYMMAEAALGEVDGREFYATTMWTQDAVPGYVELAQEIINNYQAELVQRRQMANAALGL